MQNKESQIDGVRLPRYFNEGFYVLAGNCGEQLNYKEYPKYYLDGRCTVCNLSYGERTDNNLVVNFKVPNTDTISIDHSNIVIFSERVLQALEPFNNNLYECKEVEFSYKNKTRFYELIWNNESYTANSVAVNDDEIGIFKAWKCSRCSAHSSFYQDDLGLTYYVSNEFIRDRSPDIFLLNSNRLCVSDKVHKVLEKLDLKKISIDPIGVARTEDINLNPTIEIRYSKQKFLPRLP